MYRDTVSADLVMIDDQSGRDELERRGVKAHAIWPSMARPPTPLESLGIHQPLHQKRARAGIRRETGVTVPSDLTAYIQGISTRSVDDLVKALGMGGISKSQVSRLCAEIDERMQAFLGRPIEGDWPYLWIDATM